MDEDRFFFFLLFFFGSLVKFLISHILQLTKYETSITINTITPIYTKINSKDGENSPLYCSRNNIDNRNYIKRFPTFSFETDL